MAEYTVLTLVAMAVVVIAELAWLRTGLFRQLRYWLAMLIVFAFQILVDGWLTRLPNPIVQYDPAEFAGIRFPLDIPIEDFGFGFALVTCTLLVWHRLGAREDQS